MWDRWGIKYWFEKFFTPEEVKIIKTLELEDIFIDLYDFYSHEYGTEETQGRLLREKYELLLRAYEKIKAKENRNDTE